MNEKHLQLALGILFSIFVTACSNMDDPNDTNMMDDCEGSDISYFRDIVPIINSACALSGCHVEGFSNSDFTSYPGLKARADDGQINARVVRSQDMPPSNSSGPKSLTEAQINAFKCWIEKGAHED